AGRDPWQPAGRATNRAPTHFGCGRILTDARGRVGSRRELPDATLVAFMTANGWRRGAGESLWMHASGTRASRLEALTASLTAHHEAQHQWPAFWDHQPPATGRPAGAAGLA